MKSDNFKYFVSANRIILVTGTDVLPDGTRLYKIAGLGPGPTLWMRFSDLVILDVPPAKRSPNAYHAAAMVQFEDGVTFVIMAAVADACEPLGLARSIREFTDDVIARLSAAVARRKVVATCHLQSGACLTISPLQP